MSFLPLQKYVKVYKYIRNKIKLENFAFVMQQRVKKQDLP